MSATASHRSRETEERATTRRPGEVVGVSEAILGRTSIRAFTSQPLEAGLLRQILDVARYAPSGSNMQPWRMIAVAGEARDRVVDAVRDRQAGEDAGDEAGDHPIRPSPIWEPYRTRRFKVAEDMYGKLGIPRSDKPARLRFLAGNAEFFGAPVGLFFVIDRNLGHSQWAHLGMLMQTVALAAYERGVASCMQEFWASTRQTLARHFDLPPHEMIYCGMALGFADETAPVNTLRSDRASLDEICEFRGFIPE
ncbi:nitroreductase [Phenylobacterium sp.]|uniref:nitroreductase n=1 Tax=Phenylobacterium sp. TaxID=1871053 RepID=UPI00301DE632